MLTRIHISQPAMRANLKDGADRPIITCKTYRENRYGHTAEILDDRGKVVARVRYEPTRPLSCGARCWIECEGEVRVLLRDGSPAPANNVPDCSAA